MIVQEIERNLTRIRKVLNKNSKVLSITHKGCMDGSSSQIILGNCLNDIHYMKANYHTIDETLENIKYEEYDCVIITDIAPEKQDGVLDKYDNVILLDHHGTALRHHNPDKLRFVYDGECATKLTQKFMELVFNIDLSYLDEFVFLNNDYDIWIHDDTRSKELSLLYYKYWDEKFRRRFFEGVIDFNDEELEFIKLRRHQFNTTYNNLEVFEMDSINGGFAAVEEFVNDISEKLLLEEEYAIVFIRNPTTKNISVRCNIDELHVGEFLSELGIGGGHKNAAGMHANTVQILQKNLSTIEKELYKRLPSIRKR